MYRGGGWVKCCFGISPVGSRLCPAVSFGSRRSFSSSASGSSRSRRRVSSSLASWYTASQPVNFSTEPVARKPNLPASISARTVSNTADAIWEATNRFQIRLYSLHSSFPRNGLTISGVNSRLVGRIASWASWAALPTLNFLASAGSDSLPYVPEIYVRTASIASSATRVESVRM